MKLVLRFSFFILLAIHISMRSVSLFFKNRRLKHKNTFKDKKILFFDPQKISKSSSAGERSFLELYEHISQYTNARFSSFTKSPASQSSEISNYISLSMLDRRTIKNIFLNIDYIFVRSPEAFLQLSLIQSYTFTNCKVVYYSTDIFSYRFYDEYLEENSFKSLFFSKYFKLIEPLIWMNSDFILSNRNDEAEVISHYNSNVFVIPTRPFKFFSTIGLEEIQHKIDQNTINIVFVGGSGNKPNLSAVKYIVDEIFPKFLQSLKTNFVFHLVGAGWEHLYSSNDNFIIHGSISESKLDKIYNKSLFAIAPLKYGSGIKGKVIEAMHKNLIVLTTTIGAEGINCMALNPCNTVDSLTDYANSCLGDPEACYRITLEYQKFLKKYYSEESIDKVFIN